MQRLRLVSQRCCIVDLHQRRFGPADLDVDWQSTAEITPGYDAAEEAVISALQVTTFAGVTDWEGSKFEVAVGDAVFGVKHFGDADAAGVDEGC